MSKFLTPPSWYDKNGSEINIFDNTTYISNGPFNTAIGRSAIAGRPSSEGTTFGIVAVGSQAHAAGPNSIAIGSYDETSGGSSRNVEALALGSIAIGGGAKANADSTDGIAIGRGATSEQGGIAIGGGAYANVNQIQLGDNNTTYTLNIGNGAGNIMIEEINKIAFSIVPVNDDNSVSVTESGIYLCCFSREDGGGGQSVITNNIAIIYIQPYGTNVGIVLSSQDNVCNYSSSSKKITAQGSNSILKCLRIIL